MAKQSSIEWTKSTWNPWVGCTRISPACDNCYAAEWDRRFHQGRHWGSGAPRKPQGHHADNVRTWNSLAPDTEFAGRKGFWPVFVESMGDFFDNEVPAGWRRDAWNVMRNCRNLTFILVTKRIGNVPAMLPDGWGEGWPHVWLLITVCNQEEADRDVPKLLRTPAHVRGLSLEPLLGPVSLIGRDPRKDGGRMDFLRGIDTGVCANLPGKLDWIIVGGESGSKARLMPVDWVRQVRDQCEATETAFFFKQWSSADCGKGKRPNVIDGRQWLEFPKIQPRYLGLDLASGPDCTVYTEVEAAP
jgi:protein gp37